MYGRLLVVKMSLKKLIDALHERGDVLSVYCSGIGWTINSTLNFGFTAKKISLCDILEQPCLEIGSGESVKLDVSNYEIVTLLIEF